MKTSCLALFPLLLLITIVACERPTHAINNNASLWNEAYRNPAISHAALRDTLPKKFIAGLTILEINGVKARYGNGNYTAYFEYETDPDRLLTSIASLPFKRCNAVCDTTCRALNFTFSLSGKTLLSREEIDAASFFWNSNPSDFVYYECLKYPTRHTLLIHKKTNRILHRIESIS